MASLQHMYLAEREQVLCRGDATLMTVAWCAKEAVYKWNGRRGIDFIQHMPIQFFQKNMEDYTLEITLTYLDQEWVLYPKCTVDKDFAMSLVIKERM
jgi:phosphopantetheinyl transferase